MTMSPTTSKQWFQQILILFSRWLNLKKISITGWMILFLKLSTIVRKSRKIFLSMMKLASTSRPSLNINSLPGNFKMKKTLFWTNIPTKLFLIRGSIFFSKESVSESFRYFTTQSIKPLIKFQVFIKNISNSNIFAKNFLGKILKINHISFWNASVTLFLKRWNALSTV